MLQIPTPICRFVHGSAVTTVSLLIYSPSSSRAVDCVEKFTCACKLSNIGVDNTMKGLSRTQLVLHSIHTGINYAQSSPHCQQVIC